MKSNLQSFLASILLNQLLPLIPLFFEYQFYKGLGVTERSLTIVASMYAFAVGLTSKNRAQFALFLVLGIAQVGVYGFAGIEPIKNFYLVVPFWIILFVFIIHAVERWDRHVRKDEVYFIFEDQKR